MWTIATPYTKAITLFFFRNVFTGSCNIGMLLLRDNPLVRIRANAFAGLNTIQFLYLPSWIKVSIRRTKGPQFFVFGDLFCWVFFFRPCYFQFIGILQRILKKPLTSKTFKFYLWLTKDENCIFQISYILIVCPGYSDGYHEEKFVFVPITKQFVVRYLLFHLATVFFTRSHLW